MCEVVSLEMSIHTSETGGRRLNVIMILRRSSYWKNDG